MTSESLEDLWKSLAQTAHAPDIMGRRVAGLPSDRGVYAALDQAGHRHILVLVPPDTDAIGTHDTRGLRASVERLRVGDRQEAAYVDLVSVSMTARPPFLAVAQDLLAALRSTSETPLECVLNLHLASLLECADGLLVRLHRPGCSR